jgi:hypothetical protein
MAEEDLKRLYEYATAPENKLPVGDYDTFVKALQAPENRKQLYDYMSSKGVLGKEDTPDYFNAKILENTEPSAIDKFTDSVADKALYGVGVGQIKPVKDTMKSIYRGAMIAPIKTIADAFAATNFLNVGAIKFTSDEINEMADKASERYMQIKEPKMWNNVIQTVSEGGVYFIPGVGLARGMQAANWSAKGAAVMGTSMTSFLGASSTAAKAYRTMKDKGKSEAQARKAAFGVFWTNLPIDLASDKFVFGNLLQKHVRGKAFQAAKAGLAGGAENLVTDVMNKVITNEKLNFAEEVTSVGTGFFMAGGMSMAVPHPKQQPDDIIEGTHTRTPYPEVERMHRDAEAAYDKMLRQDWDRLKKEATYQFLDVSGNLKKALDVEGGIRARDAIAAKNTVRTAPHVASIYINAAEKQVYGGLDDAQKTLLNRFIQDNRTIGIENFELSDFIQQGGNPSEFTPKTQHPRGIKSGKLTPHWQAFFNDPANQPFAHDMLKRANDYFGIMRTQLDLLTDAGLMTPQLRGILLSKGDYSRREFMQHIDPEYEYPSGVGGKTIQVPKSSVVKRLKGGSEELLNPDMEFTMREVMSATQSRIYKNRALTEAWLYAAEMDNKSNVIRRLTRMRNKEQLKPLMATRVKEYAGMPEYIEEADFDALQMDLLKSTTPKQLEGRVTGTDLQRITSVVPPEQLPPEWKYYRENQKLLPEEPPVEVDYKLVETDPKTGKRKVSDIPPDWETIPLMVNGKQEYIAMPKEFKHEWIQSDKMLSNQATNIAQWITGSKLLKASATGSNPYFAIRNLPRDFQYTLLRTTEYSPFLPKASVELTRDMGSVAGDVIGKKGWYLDYVLNGGGTETMTGQGRVFKGQGVMGKIQDVMSYAGETSEYLTRVAVYKRAYENNIKAGLSDKSARLQAANTARTIIDYSQGGSFVRAIDNGMPYLNARVQGWRGLAQTAKKDPKMFAYKAAQIMAFQAGLYYGSKYVSEETREIMEHVPWRDRINNFILPGWSVSNAEGGKDYYAIKIAKDPAVSVIAGLTEIALAKQAGETVDAEAARELSRQAFTMGISDVLPPLLKGVVGYSLNMNLFRNEHIWNGAENVTPAKQQTKYTNPVYARLGDVTEGMPVELSPDKMEYAMKQVFARNNPISDLLGVGLRSVMADMDEPVQNELKKHLLTQVPGANQVFYKLPPDKLKMDRDLKERTATAVATAKHVHNLELDKLTTAAYKNNNFEEVYRYITDLPKGDYTEDERKRLLERVKYYGRLQNIPADERTWWLDLLYSDDITRGTVFAAEYAHKEPAQQDEMMRIAYSLKGFTSGKFKQTFGKMIQGDQK